MKPLEQKLNALEQRVRQLENPDFLSDKLMSLLIANGFIKVDNTITLSEDNGLTIKDFEYATVRFLNDIKTIFLRENMMDYYVKAGSNTVYAQNNLQPGDAIVMSTTGTAPNPLIAGTLYAVLTATRSSFTLDNGSGAPIVFTNTGVGTHYYYEI